MSLLIKSIIFLLLLNVSLNAGVIKDLNTTKKVFGSSPPMNYLIYATRPEKTIGTNLMADLSFDSELRLRYESFHGANDKFYGENPKIGKANNDYLLTRIRVGINYQVDDSLLLRVSLQDSRVLGWGFESEDWYNKEFNQKNNAQEDYLELHETYVQKNWDSYELKVGRQKMAFGDNRIFGPGEWKNSGKWIWDVAKVTYKKDKNFISFFYGATMLHDEEKFSLSHRHGYYGYGAYSHLELDKKLLIEPMLFCKKNTKINEKYNSLRAYYAGLRVYGDIGNFYYDTTYVNEFGKRENLEGVKLDIDAFAFTGLIGYKVNENLKVGLEYALASGDNKDTQKIERFDGAFGASDKYYGRMNLMQLANLRDYQIFGIYNFAKKFKSKLEYHRFHADQTADTWKAYTISGIDSRHYGDEIDLVTTYKHNKALSFQLGLSYFTSGDYITQASTKNQYITDDNAYSFFTQVQYRFDTK
jgi:hypothetical protein